MALLEDVRDMQKHGKSDDEIREELKARNISEQKIEDTLSQATIKNAVVGEPEATIPEPPVENQGAQEIEGTAPEYTSPYQEQEQETAPEQPAQQVYPEAPQTQYQQYQYQAYPQQTQQLSSDVMAEIAEQALSEKLAPIKEKLEKTIDMKTTFDARITSIDERLRRIEQIIDRLQLSILQRVGTYISEVENVKKELVETQKSFNAVPQKKQQQQQKQFNRPAQTSG